LVGGDGLVGAGVKDVGSFRVAGTGEAAVMQASIRVAVTLVFASFFGSALAAGERKETVRILVATTHVGTGLDQLAVGGDTHAVVRGVTWEGRGGGNDPVGHESQDEAVLALDQPGRIGILESHAEGGCSRQVVKVESKAIAVARASFGGMEFGDESVPGPAAPTSEKPAQADADGIEGRGARVDAESLSEDGSPGCEIEQTKYQVEVVEAFQVLGRQGILWRDPLVKGATGAPCPGTNARRKLQAKRQMLLHGFPLERADEMFGQQAAFFGRDVPCVCQFGPR
jgi:hypothetical protein